MHSDGDNALHKTKVGKKVMYKTKIFAAYLPQYHETEENNKFWGKGFTDWVTVKKAEALFEGHNQPRKPLNENYYDLSNPYSIKEQVRLAKQFGVDGFNIYHYWFKNGHVVLQKPAELILENKDIEIEFFFSWDNSSWKRSWSNVQGNDWAPRFELQGEDKEKSTYLLELDYGGQEQWREHFNYLLPYFKDSRYLKIDNAPVFMFFSNIDIKKIQKMGECWKEWAKENGFNGLYLVTQKGPFFRHKVFNAEFYYQPNYSGWAKQHAIKNRIKEFCPELVKEKEDPYMYNYEKIWKCIYRQAKRTIKKDYIIGSFVSYDDTPRRGKQGIVVVKESVDLFKKYFGKIYELCCKNECDIILLTAWNEWGEGAFLEPDENNKYKYLEAVKEVKRKYFYK